MEPHVYPPEQRPQGHVLREGTWLPCELRMIHADSRLNIEWVRDGQRYLDNVPADAVRLDT